MSCACSTRKTDKIITLVSVQRAYNKLVVKYAFYTDILDPGLLVNFQ